LEAAVGRAGTEHAFWREIRFIEESKGTLGVFGSKGFVQANPLGLNEVVKGISAKGPFNGPFCLFLPFPYPD